jgi:branched-chain amino acid transport system substrate-binding protein
VSAVHEVTAAANIPLFLYSITDTAVTTDPNNTFVLFDPRSGVSALPISVAKDNKLKLVTPVVVDVPAATDLYTSESGQEPFDKAKIKVNMVPLPPGQADMTPQMSEIANGDPTVVQIVGNDAFCISAFKGLEAAAFDGPISTLFLCVTDSTRQAVGSYLKGTYVSTSTPVGDKKDPGFKQLKAIYDKYADDEVADLTQGQNTYAVFMSMFQAIEKMTGDITPATVTQTLKSMPNMDIPGGGGLIYRCNGKAKPELAAVCTGGGLRTRLDAKGFPTLPYKVVGNGPVPD